MNDVNTGSARQSDAIEKKPWWQTNWASISAGLVLGIGLITADRYGYGGMYEWAFAFIGGNSVAASAFWRYRSKKWFFPSIAFLIGAHVLVLVSHHWRIMPHHATGTAIQLKGAIWLDFGVCGGFLYCIHRLFDPQEGIRAHWNMTAKVIVSAFTLVFLSIFTFVIAVLVRAHNEKLAQSQIVFSRETSRSMYALMDCIDSGMTEDDRWDDVRGKGPGKQFFDDFGGQDRPNIGQRIGAGRPDRYGQGSAVATDGDYTGRAMPVTGHGRNKHRQRRSNRGGAVKVVLDEGIDLSAGGSERG